MLKNLIKRLLCSITKSRDFLCSSTTARDFYSNRITKNFDVKQFQQSFGTCKLLYESYYSLHSFENRIGWLDRSNREPEGWSVWLIRWIGHAIKPVWTGVNRTNPWKTGEPAVSTANRVIAFLYWKKGKLQPMRFKLVYWKWELLSITAAPGISCLLNDLLLLIIYI